LTDLEPFNIPFAELLDIGKQNPDATDFNYMEDSQARRNELDGFQLNNVGLSGAAGYTYVGQLLAHDINLDETSKLGEVVDPSTLINTNTPFLDLDTIYDFDGTEALLENDKFVVNGRDFARDADGVALIPDLRNDEHRIVSQLTVAFMTLHNKIYDTLPGNGQKFERAKRDTIKTWQSVVINDLLPNLLDHAVLEKVQDPTKRILYSQEMAEQGLMPVEFSTAAYRLFHSRARGRYRMNADTDGSDGNPRARLFDVGNEEPLLVGGSALPTGDDPNVASLVVEWNRFFFDGTDPPDGSNLSRIMDMLYSRPIMRLPIGEAGTPTEVIEVDGDIVDDIVINGKVTASLAILDLVRGQTHSLSGGIALANHVKEASDISFEVLSIDYMQNGNVFGLPPTYTYGDVPLLLYLAHESVRDHEGQLLGQLGSRIVAEVIYGLVEQSQYSILDNDSPDDSFESQITDSSIVTMKDVLEYIGWWEE